MGMFLDGYVPMLTSNHQPNHGHNHTLTLYLTLTLPNPCPTPAPCTLHPAPCPNPTQPNPCLPTLCPRYGFIFGGDLFDKGPGDIRLARVLCDLKVKHVNRVFLIMGNRSVQYTTTSYTCMM